MDQPRWIDYMRLDDLTPALRNPKGHDQDLIRASVSRFGSIDAPVLDERTGRLVAGHGRRDDALARRQRGEDPPDGFVLDADGGWLMAVQRGWASASDDDADAAGVALNEGTIAGGWKRDELADLLQELNVSDGGLAGTGYDQGKLDLLLSSLAPPALPDDPGPDVEPEAPADPITQPGDLWEIGGHRLVCGSSRDLEVVQRLVDGRPVNLGVTSPPYADRRKYDASSGFEPIDPDDYVDWFEPVAANIAAVLAPDGSWVVNIKAGAEGLDRDLYVMDLVIAHVRAWGWHFGEEFCWERTGVPKGPVLRLKNQFEPCYQFTRDRWKFRPQQVRHASENMVLPLGPGAGDTGWSERQGGNRQFLDPAQIVNKRKSNAARQGDPDDDWYAGQYAEGWAYPGNRLPTFAGTHTATGHTAAFPVGLPEWFIRLLTDEGDTVLDPFMGSGSTMLAAHKQRRRALGVELSPAYCDLTIARFEAAAGVVGTLNGERCSLLAH